MKRIKRTKRKTPQAVFPWRIFIITGVAFAIGAVAAVAIQERAREAKAYGGGGTGVGGPFSLLNQDGKRVTEKNFRGKYMLVAFGYTYCPDICPAELQVISNTMDELGGTGDNIVPIFISVDPQRDTVQQMHDYVRNFHSRIVGLTGTVDEIKAAARSYRVYYKKETSPGGGGGSNYAVTHSTFIYLMNPKGEYVTHFNYGVTSNEMVAKLKQIVKPSP
ncbi:MAG: SCO family protein [Alphaproteobacteria bacterium]